MLAYHNDPKIKTKLLADLAQHAKADKIVKGQYWRYGKGCAVACTLISIDPGAAKWGHHAAYETHFGIPQAIAHLEDKIFEGLPNRFARKWPRRFAKAIKPGAYLTLITPRFLLWLLEDQLPQTFDHAVYPACWKALESVATLYREWCLTGKAPSRRAGSAAVSAAYSAAVSAGSAAYGAAVSAASAASAAHSAASAGSAAVSAAESAAHSAAHSAAYNAAKSAHNAAKSAAYVRMADKLEELLKAAP